MTFIDGARVTKRRNGAGSCALLSKQISLQLPRERVQWKTRRAEQTAGCSRLWDRGSWPVDVNTLDSSTHPVDADVDEDDLGHSPLASILPVDRREWHMMHFRTRTAVLRKILRRTGSQWRLRRTGVIWSRRRAPETNRAAAFCMDWLKPFHLGVSYSCQQSVAVVQPAMHECLYQRSQCVVQRVADATGKSKIGKRQWPVDSSIADCPEWHQGLWPMNQTRQLT